jgi:hypothetical protein
MVEQRTNWAELAASYQRRLSRDSLRTLARQLGVAPDSLRKLGVGWREEDESWTTPEYDGQGRVIGILRRFADGEKKAMAGSQRGIYLPRGWQEEDGTIYVPEGPTDVAALLTLGLRAIGRPSSQGGLEHLAELFADTDDEILDDEILIVGDNDKKADGRWPGREGARTLAAALARELGGRVRWTMPPNECKDIREWLIKEGNRGH